MHPVVPLLALTALGIDVGWEPAPQGGWDYIIQVEPEALDALSRGVEIASDLPEEIRDVRSLRIRVGEQPVPRRAAKPALGDDWHTDNGDGPQLVSAIEMEADRKSSGSSSSRSSRARTQAVEVEPRSSRTGERIRSSLERAADLTTDPPAMGPQMPSNTWRGTERTSGAASAPEAARDQGWDNGGDAARYGDTTRPTTQGNLTRSRLSDLAARSTTLDALPPSGVEFGPVDEELQPRAAETARRTTASQLDPPPAPRYEPLERRYDDLADRSTRRELPDERLSRYDERDYDPRDARSTDALPRGREEDRRAEVPRIASRSSGVARTTLPETANDPLVETNEHLYPLTAALVGLFLSLGGNLFLGWMTLDLRTRCRRLLVRLATSTPLRSSSLAGGDLDF